MKLTLVTRKIVRPNVALVPVDIMGDEELSRLKVGEEVYTEVVNFLRPTLRQYRKFGALVKKLHDNDRRNYFPSRESCRHWLHSASVQGDTRMASVRIMRTGSTEVYLKSMKDLKRDEMSDLISRAEKIVEDELRISHAELVREIEGMIGASD